MNKDTLMKIRQIILEKQERLEELEQNAEMVYNTIWDCLVDELNNDRNLTQSSYSAIISCKEDKEIMKNISIKSYDMNNGTWTNYFNGNLEILKEDLFNLLCADKLKISKVNGLDSASSYKVEASSRKMLEYAFLGEGKTK